MVLTLIMKKKVIFAFTIISLLLVPTLNVDSSIHPIIVTDMPDLLNIAILQNVNLTWVVIDDNPRNYELYVNNTISKNGTIVSNVINIPFSAPEGVYNITLIVTDYSNNSVTSTLLINSSRYVSPSSNASSSSATTTYHMTAASSGFDFISLLFMISSLIVISKFFKLRRKK